jgi:hypothetical protein
MQGAPHAGEIPEERVTVPPGGSSQDRNCLFGAQYFMQCYVQKLEC